MTKFILLVKRVFDVKQKKTRKKRNKIEDWLLSYVSTFANHMCSQNMQVWHWTMCVLADCEIAEDKQSYTEVID